MVMTDKDLVPADAPDSEQLRIRNRAETSVPDLDIRPEGEPIPLLPEGQVVSVSVQRFELRPMFDRAWVLVLWYRILDPSLGGQMMPMYLRLPPRRTPHGSFQPARLGSKFYRMWSFAAGRKPSRRDRMTATIFLDRLFSARTRVVKKNSRGVVLTDPYSVVDEFVP
jgi:hypothetical protein